MYKEITNELLAFLKKSPSPFHAVRNMKEELSANGYEELTEGRAWHVRAGGKYYVTRNDSSIIAVHVGTDLDHYSFNVAASHTDSPTFKIKENAEIRIKDKYTQLNTEGYGGMLCATWFDRPLSVAGRVLVKENDRFITRLLNFDRDLLLIPNLAIHMNRSVNEGYAYNKQADMLPLFGGADTKAGDFKQMVASELGVDVSDIYGSDLYLYNRMEPSVWGANEEFVSAPQLDDLQCAFASLKGFLKGYNEKSVQVFACFDNEEVGSSTKQGAASTFLYDVLHRINACLGKSEEDYYRAVAGSFMLSADNAHAVHPNHPGKTDVANCTYMNEGIVVKSHAGQKYTSDAVSIAVFRSICEKAGVPVQFFANRSDEPGGSTLGNISSTKVAMNSVDIGLAQLAMHSSYETAGIKDTCYMILAMEEFYNSHMEETGAGVYTVTRMAQ
ncbi:MAG: M18 family aminopeptidase [Lachnospiraceae bacterium]